MNILYRLMTVAIVFVLGLFFVTGVRAADVEVSMEDGAFVPDSVSITAGDTVTWVNNDVVDHRVVDDDGAWDTGVIEPGGSVSVVFTSAGVADYSCSLHPTMTGTVVVTVAAVGGAGNTSSPSSQPVSGVSGPTVAIMLMGVGLLGTGLVFFRKAEVGG